MNEIIRRNPEMLSSNMDGETVMMSIENGEYYGLNEIGTRIWELTADRISVKELIEKLMDEYEVDEETCKTDVFEFLDGLMKKKLILKD
ncbi:MAG: lasso peptide biosynthesis PqqD family chaperone [Bacteroidota bacterium]